jgi:hypothetical protein
MEQLENLLEAVSVLDNGAAPKISKAQTKIPMPIQKSYQTSAIIFL